MQLHGQLPDRAAPLRPEDDQVRLLGRRDGRLGAGPARSRSGATSRRSRRWPASTTTSTSTSATRSTPTRRSRAPPTARTVQQKWGMYRKKLAVQNMQDASARRPGSTTTGTTTSSSTTSASPRTARQLYRPKRAGVPRLHAGHLQPARAASTGPSAGARTWSSSSSTSARSEAPRRRRTASATTRDTGQPDLAPTAPQSTRNVFAAVIPSLSQPVSQACKDKINSPNRTFLGKAQLQPLPARRRDLEREVEGGHERDPDPAVLRACRTTAGRATRTSACRLLNALADRERRPPRLPDHRHPRRVRKRGPLADPGGRRRARQRPRAAHRTRPTRTSSSGRSRRGRSGRRSTTQPAKRATASFSRRRSSSRRRRTASGMACAQGGSEQLRRGDREERHAQGRLQGRERQHRPRRRRHHALRPVRAPRLVRDSQRPVPAPSDAGPYRDRATA